MSIEQRCKTEIIELHNFFQAWFTGELPRTDESFARFAAVLSPQFVIIFPDGKLIEGASLLAGLRQAHNSRSDFRIWIKNVRLHHHQPEMALATYEEWQESSEGITARLSTVVFRHQGGKPNELEWLHVHETWLAQ